jgi:PAS domain S-box-containing protein
VPDSRRRSRPAPVAASPDHERALLRHDLAVHQEELRAQNQKLIDALHELEDTRDRYVELYDGAPNGYCTLDRNGTVREINLTGSTLLGQSRSAVVGSPLLPAIVPEDRGRFLGYLRTCAKGTNESTSGEEVHVRTAKADRTVQLTCRPHVDGGGALVEFFVAMVDVTERRRLEAAREEARREHMELVRRVLTLQEAERRRLARDIHDDLGQQVTALRLKLEWLAERWGGDGDLGTSVRVVQEAAERVDQHIDFLLRDLRPAGLDELGLLAVLRQTVADWSETFGIPATFRAAGVDAGRLPHEVETQAFRIVQEALNNVHKHAAATEVKVSLQRRRGKTVLTVTDNGIGLIASSAAAATGGHRRGLGLLGMRERATLIGGQLEITSTPGSGTTVTLQLP